MEAAGKTRRQVIAGGAALAAATWSKSHAQPGSPSLDLAVAELVLRNGRFTTMDPGRPEVSAVAIAHGRFTAVGAERDVMAHVTASTRVIDVGGRRVIPGLIDSHTHVIRGGLNYNLELRWDGVRSLAVAMRMLKEQVARTPAPQWVRVIGGFTEHQFAEKRLPTLDELNALAPQTPVFILHLYDRALLNAAALRAVGYTKDTPDPMGGQIARDRKGNPTGLLLAQPNAAILYSTLAKGPKLPPEYQKNSTRHFMRELNRLGVTSVIDAGGGFQNYPDDYRIIEELHAADELTVRIAYNLFTQRPRDELADFSAWTKTLRPGQGDDLYRHNGAGEMLVYSAADFEDFRQPRPDVPDRMVSDLDSVVRLLAANRWPWRLHATYDQTISQALDVFEAVNRDIPLGGLNWFLDHCETISDRNIDRVAALGGGIAIQHRMAFQGEYFVERYGKDAAMRTPPIRRMLDAGIPLGAGTDATRVASFNPWTSLQWLVAGKTVGGLSLYPPENRLDRAAALRLWTKANAWFSNETERKGEIREGQLADLAVLSDDYFAVPEERIADITSVMTVLGGKVVHGSGGFRDLAPALPAPMPDWSPAGHVTTQSSPTPALATCGCTSSKADSALNKAVGFWGDFGCACWAF
jgi:predicted amidohydrolase YtcJ